MQCPGCGAEVAADQEFCFGCGYGLVNDEVPMAEVIGEPLTQRDALALELSLLDPVDFRLEIGAHKERGDRLNQEDEHCSFVNDYPNGIAAAVMVVCDGMGGPPAGEQFARIGAFGTGLQVSFLLPSYDQATNCPSREQLWLDLNEAVEQKLPAALTAVNSQAVGLAKAKGIAEKAGATLAVVVAIIDKRYGHVMIHVAWIGDSPAYLIFNDETALQLSKAQEVGGDVTNYLNAFSSHVAPGKFQKEFWLGPSGLQSVAILLCSDGVSKPLAFGIASSLSDKATLTGEERILGFWLHALTHRNVWNALVSLALLEAALTAGVRLRLLNRDNATAGGMIMSITENEKI